MSFLAPLYVLGALGIGLPILFHLIRRQPRNQRQFSSLMFLKPTPPTLTKRSRLDNWPLLLLRALALILLAAAFARPYLRSPVLDQQTEVGKRVVLLVDTSASMRRGDLWQQAKNEASAILKRLNANDQIAVIAFDSKPRTEMSFEQSALLGMDARIQTAMQSIDRLEPTWQSGQLGDAMTLAAELLATHDKDDASSNSSTATAAETIAQSGSGHIVVVTDFQSGGDDNLKGLQSYQWPDEVKVEVRVLRIDDRSNAYATVLQVEEETASRPQYGLADEEAVSSDTTRVRVSNSAESIKSDFTVFWADAEGIPIESSRLPTQVAPGETRVVKLVDPPASDTQDRKYRLVLEGDDHVFDNVQYVLRPAKQQQTVLFVGSESDEPKESLHYYLKRAPLDNRSRTVELKTCSPGEVPQTLEPKQTPLVIVAGALDPSQRSRVQAYIEVGGSVLWVLDVKAERVSAQANLRALSGSPELAVNEAEVGDYSMWSRIDFAHPLFQPFADARFNDFTKIRFWSHRSLTGLADDVRSLVDFDDGNPALLERRIGEGRLWILTSGWQPVDSQLALSTKFVPLLFGMFGFAAEMRSTPGFLVLGQPLPFPYAATAQVQRSNSDALPFTNAKDAEQIDAPGFYRFIDGDAVVPFALNLSADESRTEVMDASELERLGVTLHSLDQAESVAVRQRQQQDVQLESSQRLWQWLLLGVLGLLGIESLMSGWIDRKRAQQVTSDFGR